MRGKEVCPKVCIPVEGIIRKIYQYFPEIDGTSFSIVIEVGVHTIEIDRGGRTL